MTDRTAHARAQRAVLDFGSVFNSSPRPLLVMAADPPTFTMIAISEAHARAFQTTPEALEGWGVLEVFGPAPDPSVAEFVGAIRVSLDTVMATGAPHLMATRAYPVQTESGETDERYWSAINAPVFGAGGEITHIVSAVQDVTGEVFERRSEDARRLLMREVDHRSRNALTVVQTFVRLTTARTLDEFRQVLSGRVEALARAQTSLAARKWEGALLREIIEAELRPLAERGAFRLDGPHVLVPALDVQAMSMVAHELATNASKYGALSTPGGSLAVSWGYAGGAIIIDWQERTEHDVTPPSRKGFGTRLISQLMQQLDGKVRYHWSPDGLHAELQLKAAPQRAEHPLSEPV